MPTKTKAKPVKPIAPTRTWKLQDAKARFSEVCRLAVSNGPQRVTRQGKESVVVIPEQDFDNLAGKRKSKSLWQIFEPLVGSKLEISREKTPMRKLDL